jgi:hypothetical protein
MSLAPQLTLQEFDKWAIDFVGPINPLGKHTGSRYIITVTQYLTRWAEAREVKDCSATTAARFIFDDMNAMKMEPLHPSCLPDSGSIFTFSNEVRMEKISRSVHRAKQGKILMLTVPVRTVRIVVTWQGCTVHTLTVQW